MKYVIDAEGKTLGRLAVSVSRILCGKQRPSYDPRKEGEGYVVVTHVNKIYLSGKKFSQKIYYHHTGYMGHLKERTAKQVFEKNPAELLRHAVRGMLPKNRLRAKRLRRLRIE